MKVAPAMLPTHSELKSAHMGSNLDDREPRTHSLTDAACPECREPLEFHQPDRNLPNRLLGTCSRCLTWILIDVNDRGEMCLTKLPKPPR